MDTKKYISSKAAREKLSVCNKTLRNWAEQGKIDHIRTDGGFRRYNLDTYLKTNNLLPKKKICYARVSSYEQKNDLINQVKDLMEKYPEYEIIKDIGSGINFKRKGLQKLIELAINNELEEIVISYKDRLCRIGFDLIEFILKQYSNAKITILHDKQEFPHEIITEDLIEIITVYSSKIHSLRVNKTRKKRSDSM
jgi:predicted site-specific integrase-resolvase